MNDYFNLRVQGGLCAGYSQSRVSVGGQCLGRRTPVRIRGKENLYDIDRWVEEKNTAFAMKTSLA